MEMGTAVEDLTGGELLDHAASLAVAQRRCEVEILKVAVQHAYLHDADSLDERESRKPGRRSPAGRWRRDAGGHRVRGR